MTAARAASEWWRQFRAAGPVELHGPSQQAIACNRWDTASIRDRGPKLRHAGVSRAAGSYGAPQAIACNRWDTAPVRECVHCCECVHCTSRRCTPCGVRRSTQSSPLEPHASAAVRASFYIDATRRVSEGAFEAQPVIRITSKRFSTLEMNGGSLTHSDDSQFSPTIRCSFPQPTRPGMR